MGPCERRAEGGISTGSTQHKRWLSGPVSQGGTGLEGLT